MEIEFHELAEDFRPQFMRALKWGVPPENGPVKLISGKVCSGFLRVHYSLQQQILSIKEEDCLIEKRILNDATLIQEMLRELARIPLLQLEAKGICEVWERVRAARQGKGGNLIVHGLTDGIVELVEAGELSGKCALFFSRYMPPDVQDEVVRLAAEKEAIEEEKESNSVLSPPCPAGETSRQEEEQADWKTLWKTIYAGEEAARRSLIEQQGQSKRHVRRIAKAVELLGSLIELPLSQRQFLALSHWPEEQLRELRDKGTVMADGRAIGTEEIRSASEKEIMQVGRALQG